MRGLWVGLMGLVLLAGCQTARKPAAAGSGDAPFNAAAYLPTYPPLPAEAAPAPAQPAPTQEAPRPAVAQAQNERIEAWLDTVAARNRELIFTDGYRLQVYTGPDRAEAMKAKETLYRHFPNLEVYLTYKQPSFRIVCGDFVSRLEAQLEARKLERYFGAPLIVAGQIRLKKG